MRSLCSLAAFLATSAAAQDKAPAAAPSTPSEGTTTVLVVPYQPIFRSAKQSKANTATEYLNRELDTKKTVQVLRAGVAVEGQSKPSLDAVNEALEAARSAEGAHRIRDAIGHRREAIAKMKENASALAEASNFIVAHHQLARALFWAAEDEEAQEVLRAAATMAPNMELPAKEYSRLYRARFAALKGELRSSPRVELLVRSVLPGAEISIDGRTTDTAPVKLVKVLPGTHIIGATAEGVDPSMMVVEVQDAAEVTIGFGQTVGGPAIGRVADAISENALPAPAIQAAQQAGRTANANFVVLGGLAKDVDHFNVHTFVLDVGSGKVSALDVTQFDLDLLTAASDVLRVVLEVEKAIDGFDGTQTSIRSIESTIRATKVVNEVDGSPDLASKRVKREKKSTRDGNRPIKPLRPTNDFGIKD
ncbi:MAG: PEGA domain-containing protein [Myxococcota bacterium]